VAADWDFADGRVSPPGSQRSKVGKITVTASHAYTRPGVYFAANPCRLQRR